MPTTVPPARVSADAEDTSVAFRVPVAVALRAPIVLTVPSVIMPALCNSAVVALTSVALIAPVDVMLNASRVWIVFTVNAPALSLRSPSIKSTNAQ